LGQPALQLYYFRPCHGYFCPFPNALASFFFDSNSPVKVVLSAPLRPEMRHGIQCECLRPSRISSRQGKLKARLETAVKIATLLIFG
jgi:hypothetical protein